MNRSSYSASRERKGKARPILVLLLVALVAAAFFVLRPGPKPTITIEPGLPAVGPSTPIMVRVSEPQRGLSALRIEAIQGEQIVELYSRELPDRPFWKPWGPATETVDTMVELGRDHQADLALGEVTLRVLAVGQGTGWQAGREEEITLAVDLEAPELVALTERPVVRQGGSGALVYRVGADAVRHGVRVGETTFPGQPLPGNEERRFALYGVPHDLEDAEPIRLFAVDEVGNRMEVPFLHRFDRHRFPQDDIRLSDGFFAKVVPEILGRTPEMNEQATPLDSYLMINRQLRVANAETLAELARGTASEALWRGPFRQLPSSRVMATYGDRRSYVYEGREVDQQVHLGYDLASYARAPVPAANRGRVVLARYLGIYGSTVVVDHGNGLMSLYSHLSEIGVEEGQEVDQGETLGRTGATGLAGGDHLHFSMLIHGQQVDPIEWWDGRWIETRIDQVLGEGVDDDESNIGA